MRGLTLSDRRPDDGLPAGLGPRRISLSSLETGPVLRQKRRSLSVEENFRGRPLRVRSKDEQGAPSRGWGERRVLLDPLPLSDCTSELGLWSRVATLGFVCAASEDAADLFVVVCSCLLPP